MTNNEAILSTISFVKEKLAGAEAGHDWFHIERVWKNAQLIAQSEPVDLFVVELSALLHDIADSKFNNGNETLGPKLAGEFLEQLGLSNLIIKHVQNIILNMSYKASLGKVDFSSKEMEVVQDADRLDAIGAIGIARAFTYGGYKNRPLYDPEIEPALNQSKEEYKNSESPTINHFYEKLFLLKDKMNTASARKIAADRHSFMERFMEQFYEEWNGNK